MSLFKVAKYEVLVYFHLFQGN